MTIPPDGGVPSASVTTMLPAVRGLMATMLMWTATASAGMLQSVLPPPWPGEGAGDLERLGVRGGEHTVGLVALVGAGDAPVAPWLVRESNTAHGVTAV